jgi:hypothetical protein
MSGLLAQVLVCIGKSCLPSSGGPPVESLKAQWKEGRLYGRIHLTFTGCLGRCDRPAQMLICHPSGTFSFAGITNPESWDALASWASASTQAGRLLAFPSALQRHLDHPWHGS